MNFKTQTIQTSSDFNNNILNPFLEKSKNYYPNSIIESNDNYLNITLLKKVPKNKYSFDYEDAIKLIFNYLKQLKNEFEFNKITYHEKLEYGFNPSFHIKIPAHIPSKELNNYSEKLFDKIEEYAEAKNIEFILDDLSIILCR